MDPYAWSWNAEALVVLGLTAAYLLALRRYRASGWRIVCFLGAMALLLAVTVTPIHTLGMHFLLTVHLLQNVVLAEWAPLLVVLGIPPALAAAIARPRAIRAFTHPLRRAPPLARELHDLAPYDSTDHRRGVGVARGVRVAGAYRRRCRHQPAPSTNCSLRSRSIRIRFSRRC